MLLSELNIGDEKRVKSISCSNKLNIRLNNMGLTKGVKVKLVRIAPLGDPIEIKLRNFYLAIRKKEAQKIEVEL